MTHFTVLVVTDSPDKLDDMLAPFNENNPVLPYRDYFTGAPEQFSAVNKLRSENLLPDGLLTWQQVADAFNAKYSLTKEDNGEYLYADDTQAWTMSTYNPLSKWDWYSIGGRWTGYFAYHENWGDTVIHGHQPLQLPGEQRDPVPPLYCDGGPRIALDFDKTRRNQGDKARTTYREYQELVAGTPDAIPWSVFRDAVDPEKGYTIEDARREYNSQPRVVRIHNSETYRFIWDDPIEVFSVSEEQYVQQARDRALPGYALLTPEGDWIAPGEMGWFGVSSDSPEDRETYTAKVNDYLDKVPDTMWIIVVDCHI